MNMPTLHPGKIFTDETDVINAIAALVPISVFFQLSDGIQAAVAGALRGMGRQKLVACLNLVGFVRRAVRRVRAHVSGPRAYSRALARVGVTSF